MNSIVSSLVLVSLLLTCAAPTFGGVIDRARSDTRTLEERVDALAAVERVYHAHRTGDRRPFEQAVPRAMLERRIERYLADVRALETAGDVRIAAEAVDREWARIHRDTAMPQRLRELCAALGDDPERIRETLVRPLLLARVTASPGESSTAPAAMTDDTWNNGVLADPAADPLTPIRRKDHSFVWTGTHAIVWGGVSANNSPLGPLLGDGGMYDPVLDAWSTVSFVGALSAR